MSVKAKNLCVKGNFLNFGTTEVNNSFSVAGITSHFGKERIIHNNTEVVGEHQVNGNMNVSSVKASSLIISSTPRYWSNKVQGSPTGINVPYNNLIQIEDYFTSNSDVLNPNTGNTSTNLGAVFNKGTFILTSKMYFNIKLVGAKVELRYLNSSNVWTFIANVPEAESGSGLSFFNLNSCVYTPKGNEKAFGIWFTIPAQGSQVKLTSFYLKCNYFL